MNLIGLKYFIAIADFQNFTKAAEHLYVTQPTLSRQIADLEDELGVQLLERTKRSVSLTPLGRIYYEEAKEIVQKCDALMEKMSAARGKIYGSLKVGFQGFLDTQLLNGCYQRMSQQYPDINISLNRDNFGNLNFGLLNGSLDLILTVNAGLCTMPNLKTVFVEPNYLKIIVPKNHRLAARDSLSLSEVADENFIMLERSVSPLTVDNTLALCVKAGFSPNVAHYVRDAQTLIFSVEAEKGIGFLFSKVPLDDTKNIKVLDITDCDIDFNIVAVYKKDNANPAIPLFLKELNHIKQLYC